LTERTCFRCGQPSDADLCLACELAERTTPLTEEYETTLDEPTAPAPTPAPQPLQFLEAKEFLEHDYPKPEPLAGQRGDLFLGTGTLTIVYGPEGSGKSTFSIDAMALLASGSDWLGIDVARPVRFCIVENEGGAGLFQQKLADRAQHWGEPDNWLDNVFVFAEPWGAFSFAHADHRQQLREFCIDQDVDIVLANPLLGVGARGSGKPDETSAFIEALKEIGLWKDLGFWLLHHENKVGQISGDWGRHPDLLISLARDGDAARTKLHWQKTRWVTLPTDERPLTQLLGWKPEHHGYELLDVTMIAVSDDEILERVDAYLDEHPWTSKTKIREGVQGSADRIGKLLDTGLENGRYSSKKGSRNAVLCALNTEPASDPFPTLEDWVERGEQNPHG
jgi:hypothetical protein